MPNVEMTNMVMVQDKATGKVVVQDRLKKWKGISFPGGHVQDRESMIDSAVREIKEETGLDIKNLVLCGIVHWCHRYKDERYLEFFYKTTDYSGTLIDATDEGKVFWVDMNEIKNMNLSPNFGQYLKVYENDEVTEAFGLYDDTGFDNLEFIKK